MVPGSSPGGPTENQAVTSTKLVAVFSFAYNLHTFSVMNRVANHTSDIFAPIRERLFRISNMEFHPQIHDQFASTIDEVIGLYFQLRHEFPVEIIENLLDEVIRIKSQLNEFIHNIIIDVKEDNVFQPNYERIELKQVRIRKQAEESILKELSFYEHQLNNLIEKTNYLNAQDIQNNHGRLKFKLQMKEVLGLMRLLKDAGYIEVEEIKDLANFAAQNFSTNGKDDDYKIRNLQKQMSPDPKTLTTLQIILAELQKSLASMRKSKT